MTNLVTKADKIIGRPKLILNRSRKYQTPGACALNALIKEEDPGKIGTMS